MNFGIMTTRKNGGKAGLIIVGLVVAIALVALIAITLSIGISNKIIRLDQAADREWAQVQSQYQRRLDLIPNLVNTVKGAAQQEIAVVVGAVKERAKATQVTIDPKDPAQFQQFAQAQSQLGGALSRLLVTVERYPEIKTNQNFLELQSQIEGTENRISVERGNFNSAVQAYNNVVLTFPGSLIASFKNFQKRPFFQGDTEAQKAPKVDFGPNVQFGGTPAGATPAPGAAPTAGTSSGRPAGANAGQAPGAPAPGSTAATTPSVPAPPSVSAPQTSTTAPPEG
jgi:LemA protein